MELERKGDQLVLALGNVRQDETLEDRHVVRQETVVRHELFRGIEVDAGRVDADESRAMSVLSLEDLREVITAITLPNPLRISHGKLIFAALEHAPGLHPLGSRQAPQAFRPIICRDAFRLDGFFARCALND